MITLEETRKTVKQKFCIKRHTFKIITSHSRAIKKFGRQRTQKTLKWIISELIALLKLLSYLHLNIIACFKKMGNRLISTRKYEI